MAQAKNQVLETSDYSIFKKIAGNRKVNQRHVDQLQKSIADFDLKIPIIVNETLQVIDGQHRLQARKNLNVPVFYYIVEGLGLTETQRANANSINWTTNDFAESFVEQNFYHYKVYKQFRQTYQFGHMETITILSGVGFGGANSYVEDFRNGNFYVKDVEKATEIAEKIYQIKPFYSGFKRRSFVSAMLQCFKHDQYNHEEFISKLSYQSSKLVDCTNIKQYLTIIDEIYNFKRKLEEKVRFQ